MRNGPKFVFNRQVGSLFSNLQTQEYMFLRARGIEDTAPHPKYDPKETPPKGGKCLPEIYFLKFYN